MDNKNKTFLLKKTTTAILLATAANVFAGSFSLYTEGSTVAVGDYAAGIAAEVPDASTNWYNPAGLPLLEQKQLIISGVGVFPRSYITGNSTLAAPFPLPNYVQSFANLQGATNGFVPAIHYAQQLGPNAAWGISLASPFGLKTEWNQSSPVRYAATETQLITVNLSPGLGGRITENLTFGAALDLQWAKVKFNSMLGTPNLLTLGGFSPYLLDSSSVNQGKSIGFGFHAGLLGSFNNNHTRLGVNYQSKVNHQFNGKSTLTGPLASPVQAPNGQFTLYNLYSDPISLPDILTISGYQDVNDKLALLGSVVFTGWNVFNNIVLNNVAAIDSTTGHTAALNVVSHEQYKNTWRFALGAKYEFNNNFSMRVGGGYDQTPTVDQWRSVRIPDSNRWALSIGGHWLASESIAIDAGYTHLFAQDSQINRTDELGPGITYNVTASTKANVNMVGVQVNWIIDKCLKGLDKDK